MRLNSFIKRMIGKWIIQSTNYSLLNTNEISCNFVNKMRWHYIQENKECLDKLFKHNHIDLLQKKTLLYSVQLINDNKNNNNYYLALITDQLNQSFLLKFDASFNMINKFFIKKIDEDSLYLSTYVNQFEVLQKIYFLNNNVKLIKVTIRKGSSYIGTLFTSEIRIS